jgi:acyl carrier protein
MSDGIFEKVRAIIAEKALVEPSDVTPDSTPEDLGLDSLAMVELVLAIEEAFGVKVPYDADDPDASEFDFSTAVNVAEGVRELVKVRG